MHIGLYFGSFNPIHTGHLIIANHVAQYTNVQQVWLVVSPQNPLKPAITLLKDYDRLHLVNLAIEGNAALRSSDIEFHLPKPSYTIDTLTYLSEKYPQHSFSVIMGSDSYMNLRKWKNYEKLLELYPVIVYERPQFPVVIFERSSTTIVQAPMLDISASFIRQQIQAGKSIQYLTPDKVKIEIENNGWYK
jgi:nicotinate-nucleotide adenylyltransferase